MLIWLVTFNSLVLCQNSLYRVGWKVLVNSQKKKIFFCHPGCYMALPKNILYQFMYNCVNLQVYYNKVFSLTPYL